MNQTHTTNTPSIQLGDTQLDNRVEAIRRLAIHEKSRRQYNAANAQFIMHLMEYKQLGRRDL